MASGKSLKQNLENLFAQLNRIEFITSKERYDQVLGLFQVEIRKAGRGHMVFVTDEHGNPIRHPVRMSDFGEKPRFFQMNSISQKSQIEISNKRSSPDYEKGNGSLKSLISGELMLQVVKHRSDQKANKLGTGAKSKRRKGKRY